MSAHTPHTPLRRQVLSPPQTRLGWWSVGLAGTSLVLIAFSFILLLSFLLAVPTAGVPTLVGWAGGVVGLIAVLRMGERSGLVWVAMVLGLVLLSVEIWGLVT
jgi:hypothetical protein